MAAPFPSPTQKWHSKAYESISPRRPQLSVAGKAVVVTGGGTGIGAATARCFCEAGASRIALLGRRQQPLQETKAALERDFANIEVFVASTDVTDHEQVNKAFSDFASNGEIDVLVSGAATTGPIVPVKDVDGESFLGAIQTNLSGSFFVAQAFLRHAATDAVVIDVNSSAAHLNFAPGFAAYNVAKLAVYRFWDSVAFENPDLRVFHIQPGIVDTDMNKAAGGVAATGFSDDGTNICHVEVIAWS